MSNKIRIIVAVILGVAAVAILGSVLGGKPDVTPGPLSSDSSAAATTSATKQAAPKPSPTVKLTEDQENAIGKAQDYLNFMPFSKVGLANQMAQFDHFKRADALFAVSHIKVDWNEQAVKKAQSYLDFSHFSRAGMIAQLKYDKFTEAEAKYGTQKAFDSAG